MKLFLDDIRQIDKDLLFSTVKNYNDCIMILRAFKNFNTVSLDYSLGEEKNGLDVLIYMKENNIKAKQINIHSDHEIGVPLMSKYAKENFPNSEITFNKV